MNVVHQRDVIKRSGAFTAWERARHGAPLHWLIECMAEMVGVFLYCYSGIGAAAAFTIGTLAKEEGLGSLLMVGLGYAFGILFAITVCAGTSGGHFSPGVTIALTVFKGFPPLKAVRYIIFQILGSYIACMLVYAQYHDLLRTLEAAARAKGPAGVASLFTGQGVAGIIGLYISPTASIGRAFTNELVACIFLGLVIWAIMDPSNLVCPPQVGPWVISFGYAAMIWGFGALGLSLNTARDVGGRLAAVTIWGSAGNGASKSYCAIAALTNIPATLFAAFLYELLFADSDRVLSAAHLEFISAHQNHLRNPARDTSLGKPVHGSSDSTDEKGHVDTLERHS